MNLWQKAAAISLTLNVFIQVNLGRMNIEIDGWNR
jgi:hypothetical protein